MLAAALEAEVGAYIEAHVDQLDEDGRRQVVRNGHHLPRQVLTSSGAIEVTAPRINDKRTDDATSERRRFLLGDPGAVVPQEPEDRGRKPQHRSTPPNDGRVMIRAVQLCSGEEKA